MTLIHKTDESMGKYHWETKFHASESRKEMSITQTWFDGMKVISKQNVIITLEEMENTIRKIKK